MKMFVLSDNTDTLVGMMLAGAAGVVVHEKDEALEILEKKVSDRNCGVILITPSLKALCDDFISAYTKKNPNGVLFLEIPDRHGSIKGSIDKFIEKSLGIKIHDERG